MRVNDAPYPWDYLVRPKEATVETAFQGLLVTRSGEYVWQTKEGEAFSQTSYRVPRPPSEWEKEEDRRVIVKPNSVTFRSTDYKKDKAMIDDTMIFFISFNSGRYGSFVQAEFLEQLGVTRVFDHVD